MIIINLDNKTTIDKALKSLKNKVIKTKQNEILRDRKEYTKKSVLLRTQKKKAIYKQKSIKAPSDMLTNEINNSFLHTHLTKYCTVPHN